MATFLELVSDVYTVTGRPDLIAETKLAVKSATLKAHQSDFYFKDIFDTGIQFDSAAYKQQINLRAIMPRYRALKYFRSYLLGSNFTIFTDHAALKEMLKTKEKSI